MINVKEENTRLIQYEKTYLIIFNAVLAILLLGKNLQEFSILPIFGGDFLIGIFHIDILESILIFFALFVFSYLKYQVIKHVDMSRKEIFLSIKTIEIIIILTMVILVGLTTLALTVIILNVVIATIEKGGKYGLYLTLTSLLVFFLLIFIIFFVSSGFVFSSDVILGYIYKYASSIFIQLIVNLMFTYFGGKIHENIYQGEHEKNKLIQELNEKYNQLSEAQEEIKENYFKIRDANVKLEKANEKLTNSIAEFYTLQEISQVITSIFDIKELMRNVNDVILGVLGVSNSTVILYDEKRDKLKVSTTSIKSSKELVSLNDNINSQLLLNVLKSGKILIENFVDSEEFPFTRGRDVKSFLCLPFNTRAKKYGLILIEHNYVHAFEDEKVNLLKTITLQLGIALENAELYQKMQNMATTDGLTGVYNRMYLHDKLKEELLKAQELNYPITLAIFDIDHFKKFNDTYGHLFGDKVLKNTAELVQNSLRGSDIIARFGGEEFIIIMPRTSVLEAYQKLDNLRIKISRNNIVDNLVSTSITASFGLAGYPNHAESDNELIRFADDALYEAKKSGRNCVMVAVHKSELEVETKAE